MQCPGQKIPYRLKYRLTIGNLCTNALHAVTFIEDYPNIHNAKCIPMNPDRAGVSLARALQILAVPVRGYCGFLVYVCPCYSHNYGQTRHTHGFCILVAPESYLYIAKIGL